jgi:hypothetical protein
VIISVFDWQIQPFAFVVAVGTMETIQLEMKKDLQIQMQEVKLVVENKNTSLNYNLFN